MKKSSTPELNLEKLLERVLMARPESGPADVRRLAPPFRDIADDELAEMTARIKQRIIAKSIRK